MRDGPLVARGVNPSFRDGLPIPWGGDGLFGVWVGHFNPTCQGGKGHPVASRVPLAPLATPHPLPRALAAACAGLRASVLWGWYPRF